MKKSNLYIKLLLIGVLLLGFQPAAFSDDLENFEKRGTYVVRQWLEAFKRLNTRNNIVIVLSNESSFYEVENVVNLESQGHFLVARCEPSSGMIYYNLVNPNFIMLIKESPRSGLPKKSDPVKNGMSQSAAPAAAKN